MPEPISASKWPFSAGHPVPDEPCAGRRATRPRVVRRIAEDVVGLFLVRNRDFAPCGSVFGIVVLGFPSSSFLDWFIDPELSVTSIDAPEYLPWYGATCGSVYTVVAF